MQNGRTATAIARVAAKETFRMLGGSMELVAGIEEPAGDVVLLRSHMAPGTVVPLHSHADPECFLVLAGDIEAFADDGRGWRPVIAGDSVSMENGVAHSIRAGAAGADLLIATNHRLAGFFREAQRPGGGAAPPGLPSAEDVARFVETAKAYGYWMSSPDEHAAVTGRPIGPA